MSAAATWRRAWRWVLLPLAVVAVIVGVAIAWLAFTTQGARTIVQFGSRAIDLRYATLDGTLARGLDITDFELRTPGVILTLERATLRWRPQALLRGTFAIERLTLARGELRVTETDAPADSAAPRVPLPIDIESLEVLELAFVTGDTRRQLDLLTASLHAVDDNLSLRSFALKLGAHRAQGHAAVQGGGESLAADVSYTGEIAGDGAATPLAGHVKVDGPRSRLAVALTLSSPFSAVIEGEVDAASASPSVKLRGNATPNPWLAAQGVEARTADIGFSAEGSVETFALAVATTLQLPDQPALGVTLDVKRLPDSASGGQRAQLHWRVLPAAPLFGVPSIEGGGELVWHDGRLDIDQTLTQPSPVALQAQVEPGDRPRVSLRGHWQSLALMFGTTSLRSPRGEIGIDGVFPDFAITLDARIEEAKVGVVDVRVEGALGEDRFDLNSLHAALLDGTLDASGALTSLASRRGEFDLNVRGVDLERVRAGLSTTLDADARATLDGSRVLLELTGASGHWRQHAIAADGDIEFDAASAEIALRELRLRIGRNRLALDGAAGNQLALEFEIEAPAIGEIDASLAGSVAGKGSVRGTPTAPMLDAELTATALAAGDLRVGQASLRASVSPMAASTLTLDAANMRSGDTALGNLTLKAAGTLAEHTVELDAGQGERLLLLRSRGHYVDGRIDGVLNALSLTWPELGHWALGDAASWRYAAGALWLTPLCVTQDAARVCVDADDLTADDGRVHARLTRVPMSLATPWLPPHVEIAGALDGELTATRAHGIWQPRGHIGGDGVTLTAQQSSTQSTHLHFAPLALDFSAVEGGQQFKFTADSTELGNVSAGGTLRDTDGASIIDATLRMARLDLGALAALLPALDGSEGHLELAATVQGPLSEPAVNAQGSLVDGRMRLERVGVELDLLQLDAAMRTPARIDLDLTLGQGEQRLAVTGHVERAPAWPFDLQVSSERFTVIRRADLDADIAPDLHLDGTLENVRLRGSLGLPLLHVRLQKLTPGAVAVSADEVIIDSAGAVVVDDTAESSGLRFYRDHVTGEVRVSVGDDARVAGLGLEAKLVGALTFTKDTDSLGFADGRIALQDGQYIAYRQTLNIETGELSFAGAIDHPRLDVLAVRPDIDVTAGVQITGTVQTPIVRLYSSPTMADLETLSYVITGEPLSGSDKSAASMLSKAALGLGLEQASGLTDQLRAWFALDQLGISGGDTVQDTSFVAGKQLSPRMNVRSEFNPFDRLWSVFLNYELTKHWSVEGESGARQGADLIYSIERETLF